MNISRAQMDLAGMVNTIASERHSQTTLMGWYTELRPMGALQAAYHILHRLPPLELTTMDLALALMAWALLAGEERENETQGHDSNSSSA